MNNVRNSCVLRLIQPEAIGNAGHNNYTQGVDFKQCHREILDATGDELEDEPHQLKNGNTFG